MPFDDAHIMQWLQRNLLDPALPLGIHVHQRDRLVLLFLRKGILEQGTGITHMGPLARLGRVQVTQCGVIEGLEQRRRHPIRAAYGQWPLGFTLQSAIHEAMGQHYATPALSLIGRLSQQGSHGFLVSVHIRAQVMSHRHRIGIGDTEENYLTGSIGKHHGCRLMPRLPHDVDATAGQGAGTEGQPFGAVVVAGDEQHGHAQFGVDSVNHIVQEGNRTRGRYGAIVDITGHQHRIHLRVTHDIDQLIKHMTLVVQQGDVVELPSQMPIGSVQETHGAQSAPAYSCNACCSRC